MDGLSKNSPKAFANEVFDELMTEKFGQIDYKNKARLIPGLNQGGGNVKLKAIVLNNAPVVVDGIYSVTRDTQVKRTAVDIVVQDVEFLTPKANGDFDDAAPSPAPAKKKPVLQAMDDDSDIPF